MERVPKDVLRLLLTRYFEPNDAVKCYRNIPIFYNSCDKETVIMIKRRYFSQFYVREPAIKLQSHNNLVCLCGVQCGEGKMNIHIRRCRLGLIPHECPVCYRPLITEGGLVLLNHMSDFCTVKRQTSLSTRQIFVLIYIGIVSGQLFTKLIQHFI
jgi:hypothetical protein